VSCQPELILFSVVNFAMNAHYSILYRVILIPVLLGSAVLLAEETQPILNFEAHFPLDHEPIAQKAPTMVTSYADVIDTARPAIVTIASETIVKILRSPRIDPMEDFLRRFYGMPSPKRGVDNVTTEERRVQNGIGSGVIISPDGYILTNNHVVTDERGNQADAIIVTLQDNKEYSAEVIGRDPQTDVALLKIDAGTLPSLPMADSENLRVGDIVFAIGNPLGLDQTVTMGIVSATGRSHLGILGNEGYENFIQTDAAINQGNSGGALVDACGRLIGINTAIFSNSGGSIGIGFAIPVNMARNTMQGLLETGKVDRGFLGVRISDLTSDLAEAFHLKKNQGVLVDSVEANSAAERAGLARGDVIVSVNGKSLESVKDLRLVIAQSRPGSTLPIVVIRKGKELSMKVTLGSQEGESIAKDDVNRKLGTSIEWVKGVQLSPLNDALRSQFKLNQANGLVITEVDSSSPFASVLAPGMLILEINNVAVSTLDEATTLLHSGANHVFVAYRGNQGYVAIRLP
jgi:serine protease Do/serine protease DegQ